VQTAAHQKHFAMREICRNAKYFNDAYNVQLKVRNIAALKKWDCPDGEIGRRSRLKICRSQERAGSIPVPGTKSSFYKMSFFCVN
jgi:hypothetical protein